MADLNEISAQEIGRRLRLARENANIRQNDAAKVIALSRPTLVAIEKGERRIRIQELQALASHYGVSVNGLLRREAVHTDLLPRFRRLNDTESAQTIEAVHLLNNLVRADVELENILGINCSRKYPPERGINQGNVTDLAEGHAQELRDWLGLGSGPVTNIFNLIEFDLGIRLYQRRLTTKSKVSGLFAYDDRVGACILLNANHPWTRRVYSAAHELGHFIGTRRSPEILEVDEHFRSREERYADAFGRAFLTPQTSFSRSFRELTAGASKLTRRHIILLSHQFDISREACIRRLEELDLVRKGTSEWFKNNGGITIAHERAVLGKEAQREDPTKEDADRPISQRMALRAYEAWRRELMSEGQLAELLKVQRVALRELLDQIELEEQNTDDVLNIPN